MIDQDTTVNADAAVAELPEWHKPALTRLSLDETLYSSGSNIDGHGGSGQP